VAVASAGECICTMLQRYIDASILTLSFVLGRILFLVPNQ